MAQDQARIWYQSFVHPVEQAPYMERLQSLLDSVAEKPKGPRLVLVDSLGIGPRARERMTLAATTYPSGFNW